MQYWGLTDPGCVRSQNQDAYQMVQLDRGTVLCVVCDGMGGAKSGNVASSLAVDVFVEEIRRTWTSNMDDEKIDRMLEAAVKLTNFTVFDQAQQFEEFNGMGTTLVAALIRNRSATVVNVGDSRAYSVITRAIGTESVVECDLFRLDVERGDAIFLCTDGVTNIVDEQEILFEVVHGVNKQYCCQHLLDIAKSRGAPDNVTGVLVLI